MPCKFVCKCYAAELRKYPVPQYECHGGDFLKAHSQALFETLEVKSIFVTIRDNLTEVNNSTTLFVVSSSMVQSANSLMFTLTLSKVLSVQPIAWP